MFLMPFWCFSRQRNGQMCTARAYGVFGSCGKHRFSRVPGLRSAAEPLPPRRRAPAGNNETIRVDINRDGFDLATLAVGCAGVLVAIMQFVRG
jgi:hypothetical protein